MSDEPFRSYEELWRVVAETFNDIEDLNPRWEAKATTTWWTRMVVGALKNDPIHYEWIVREKDQAFDVCLHFEFGTKAESESWLGPFVPSAGQLSSESRAFAAEPFGEKSSELRYRIPLEARLPTREQAIEAAYLMKRLIDRTYPTLRRILNIRG